MYQFVKRFIDITLSLIALLLLSPILLPVCLILLVTGERYVFYLQERIGIGGKPFKITKFATMLLDSPNLGAGSVTLRNDPRVTRVGSILRKTKVNELPQLLNILKGDMSFVGPRPLMQKTYDCYSDEVKQQINRLTPGLTGMGSIVFRDEEKIISTSELPPFECYRRVIAPVKGDLETWYAEHRSTFLDLKIICLTAWAVVFPSWSVESSFSPEVASIISDLHSETAA